MSRLRILPPLAVGLLLATAAAQEKGDGKAEKLDGKWYTVRQEQFGGPVPEAVARRLSVVIDGDKMEWYIGNPAPNMAATITVDPEKKTIDAKVTRGSLNGKTMLGIYKIEDGMLHVCWAEIDAKRPEKFATTKPGGGAFEYTVYSRTPAKEKTAGAPPGPPPGPPPAQPPALPPRERATLKGLKNNIDVLAVSPDGKTLLAGGSYGPGGELKLWDLTTGRERPGFKGGNQWAITGAFSPDGKTLAAAGPLANGEARAVVRFYDPEGKRPPAELPLPFGVIALAFSPDSKLLALGCGDSVVRVLDTATRREKFALDGVHTEIIQAVAFSPDGKTIASGGYDKLIGLWDAATGKRRAVLKGHTDQVRGLAFSPDGKLLASAGWDKSVRLWDPAAGEPKATLAHRDAVLGLAFSPDGKTLAAATTFGDAVVLWDVESGKERTGIKKEQPYRVAFTPDGKTLVVGAAAGVVTLYDLPAR